MILIKASSVSRLHGFRFIQRKAYDSFHFEFVIAAYPKILYPRIERKLRAKRVSREREISVTHEGNNGNERGVEFVEEPSPACKTN